MMYQTPLLDLDTQSHVSVGAKICFN
jgi:hypothetical protein